MQTGRSENAGSEENEGSQVPYAEPAGDGQDEQGGSSVDCPGCGSEVPDDADACPSCGWTLYGSSEGKEAKGIGLPGTLSFILAFVVLLVGFALFFLGGESGWEEIPSALRRAEGVTYRVVADGPVSVTYRDREENMVQEVNVPTPWTYPGESANEPFRPGPDQHVQVVAQKVEWKKAGRIKVQILVNGEVWKEDVCTGTYCIVSVDDVFRNAPE